jgi:uncharacterized protein YcsI (UPF0317 family)
MVAAETMNTGAEIRAHCRTNDFTRQTSGLAPGYVQCNIVILPKQDADQFASFCQLNPKPCPLLATSPTPGAFDLPDLGHNIDIRTDLPRYRIWENGQYTGQRDDIVDLWQDDWMAFALGCSFSFEEALSNAGIEIRNVSEGVNVPMYRTNIDCQSAGPFKARMVVSMRPMLASDAIAAIQICSRYPSVHGAPIHLGDPTLIGIGNLNQPDFGDPVSLYSNEIPLFWACGVTPQVALESAKLPLAITHEPGHMLVTDLTNASLEGDAKWNA